MGTFYVLEMFHILGRYMYVINFFELCKHDLCTLLHVTYNLINYS